MKELLFIVTVILMLQGCATKIEIPNKHAGIVKRNEQVETQVLKAGEHVISFGLEVIVYDISQESLETEIDFLFKDVSGGTLKIEIEFKPIVDSLSGFYREYQSLYVPPVVEVETRLVVINLLKDYDPHELSKEELKAIIIKAISENYPITNYVDIRRVNLVELKY